MGNIQSYTTVSITSLVVHFKKTAPLPYIQVFQYIFVYNMMTHTFKDEDEPLATYILRQLFCGVYLYRLYFEYALRSCAHNKFWLEEQVFGDGMGLDASEEQSTKSARGGEIYRLVNVNDKTRRARAQSH